MSTKKLSKLSWNDYSVKCKNGCGYYGNPSWGGYCSQCYKIQRTKSLPASNKGEVKIEPASGYVKDKTETSVTKSRSFSLLNKFEKASGLSLDGKRSVTVTKVIKKSSQEHTTSVTAEAIAASRRLQEFLRNNICDPSLFSEVFHQCTVISAKIKDDDMGVEQKSELMQSFYQKLMDRFEGLHDASLIMDKIEMFLTISLHKYLYNQKDSDDQKRNILIQQRIKSFQWITLKHLELDIALEDANVVNLLRKATKEISRMHSNLAPEDKLSCNTSCCRTLNSMLQICSATPINADIFLPTLIYIIMEANPPNLQSDIQFIMRFTNSLRLNSGETGYYFTNLCCAVAFIENLQADQLSMTTEEFERHMIDVTPPDVERMNSHSNIMINLSERQNNLKKEYLKLEKQLLLFQSDTLKKIQALLEIEIIK